MPFGDFKKALKVQLKLKAGEQDIDTTYWFVNNVGFVKQTFTVAGSIVVLELESFKKKYRLPPKLVTGEILPSREPTENSAVLRLGGSLALPIPRKWRRAEIICFLHEKGCPALCRLCGSP